MKKIRNFVVSIIVLFLLKIFGNMPYSLNQFIGCLFGKIFFSFDLKYRYRTYKNLSRVFTKKKFKEIKKIAVSVYCNLGKNLFELFLFKRIKYILNRVVVFDEESRALLRSLYLRKKGVIIFSAHIGNWELLGATLALNNFPLAVIVKNFYIPKLNEVILKLRNSVKEIVIGRGDKASIRSFLYALKKGYVIGVLLDQNIKDIKSEVIPFLGIKAPTPISFIELAIKYNIPCVVGFILRERNKHRVVIKKIEENWFKDKYLLANNINNSISDVILSYPQQWTWMHNRWD